MEVKRGNVYCLVTCQNVNAGVTQAIVYNVYNKQALGIWTNQAKWTDTVRKIMPRLLRNYTDD